MVDVKKYDFQSQLLEKGHFDKALQLAVRGTPALWQPNQVRVDLEGAVKVYVQELTAIDGLGAQRRYFSAGPLAAAMVSLSIYPEAIEIWRAIAELEWNHCPERGYDVPGHILLLIHRHQSNAALSNKPTYQYYLFQALLAAIEFGVTKHADGEQAWVSEQLPQANIADLLQRVRTTKELKHSTKLFRPPGELIGRTPGLPMSEMSYDHAPDLALDLAKTALKAERLKYAAEALEPCWEAVMEMAPPAELRHPAALAAAVFTLLEWPEAKSIWEGAFNGTWRHADGLYDPSGILQAVIRTHNRRPGTLEDSVKLFARCREAIRLLDVRRNPVEADRFKNLPRGSLNTGILKAWKKFPIQHSPTISFRDDWVMHAAAYEQPASDARESLSPNRKHPSKTGLLAETWLLENLDHPNLRLEGEIIDCRTNGEGFDFKLISGGKTRFIEVKGMLKPKGPIRMSEREYREAKRFKNRYSIVVVADLDGNPTPKLITNPAKVLEPKLKITYRPLREWVVSSSQLAAADSSAVD